MVSLIENPSVKFCLYEFNHVLFAWIFINVAIRKTKSEKFSWSSHRFQQDQMYHHHYHCHFPSGTKKRCVNLATPTQFFQGTRDKCRRLLKVFSFRLNRMMKCTLWMLHIPRPQVPVIDRNDHWWTVQPVLNFSLIQHSNTK